MELYPYQEIGRDFLSIRKEACLWDEPGLGKSFQSLSALQECGAETAIIICPASVRMVWKTECAKIGLGCVAVKTPKDVTPGVINILSYEGATGKCFDALMRLDNDVLICDEAHYLKSFKAKRTKKILGAKFNRRNCIAAVSERVWLLTGTPMPNNPAELWPILHSLFPDSITMSSGYTMNYWQFVNKYCTTKETDFGTQITGGQNLIDLREKIRGRALRRKKGEVLKDLPPIRYHTLPVQGDIGKVTKEESELVLECENKEEPLEYLQEIGTHIASLRKITGLAKTEAVIKWVKESPYDKIVLFAHHRAVIDKLREIENSVHVDGGCTQKEKEKAVDDFQNGDARVFIGQLQAAGTGLTLTAASVLLFVESSFVPAENRQAADRIHRIGQEDSCLVYFAMIPGSLDESIIRIVKNKTEIYKEMGL